MRRLLEPVRGWIVVSRLAAALVLLAVLSVGLVWGFAIGVMVLR